MRLLNDKHLRSARFASDDPSRYALNGVLIQETEKGVRTVATNGRRLALVESNGDMTAGDFPVIPQMQQAENTETQALLPREELLKALKELPKKGFPVLKNALVKMGRAASTLAVTDLRSTTVLPVRNIDAVFPPYENAMPAGKPVYRACVSAKSLADTLKYCDETGNEFPVLEFFGPKKPLRIVSEGNGTKVTLLQQMAGMP